MEKKSRARGLSRVSSVSQDSVPPEGSTTTLDRHTASRPVSNRSLCQKSKESSTEFAAAPRRPAACRASSSRDLRFRTIATRSFSSVRCFVWTVGEFQRTREHVSCGSPDHSPSYPRAAQTPVYDALSKTRRNSQRNEPATAALDRSRAFLESDVDFEEFQRLARSRGVPRTPSFVQSQRDRLTQNQKSTEFSAEFWRRSRPLSDGGSARRCLFFKSRPSSQKPRRKDSLRNAFDKTFKRTKFK